MKTIQEILRGGVSAEEYSRIPHMVYLGDFNTNHPSSNRIDRIASEINDYLKYARKGAKLQRGDSFYDL